VWLADCYDIVTFTWISALRKRKLIGYVGTYGCRIDVWVIPYSYLEVLSWIPGFDDKSIMPYSMWAILLIVWDFYDVGFWHLYGSLRIPRTSSIYENVF
jgi:hypothetical protein